MKKPAHEVILQELKRQFRISIELDKKMADCRKRFRNDSPYQTESVISSTKILLLFQLLMKIYIPRKEISEIIKELQELHSKTETFGTLFIELIRNLSE
ncbi:MAG: hypothetical protein PHC97_00020 [Patescibacteria group bacterium]|nr:hypothetical protein [Patescibacteria group bacterium]